MVCNFLITQVICCISGYRPHFCKVCVKGFQTNSDLKRHEKTQVHKEMLEEIAPSGGEIENHVTLQNIIANVQEIPALDDKAKPLSNESDFEPVKKKLKMGCSYCDRMFMDTKKLETHVEKIHSYSLEKDFVCSECGKEFCRVLYKFERLSQNSHESVMQGCIRRGDRCDRGRT